MVRSPTATTSWVVMISTQTCRGDAWVSAVEARPTTGTSGSTGTRVSELVVIPQP